MNSKLLTLVLVMAIAGLVLASAEDRVALLQSTAPSSMTTAVGAIGWPWQLHVLRRGDKRGNGLTWRWDRDPPSGPSSRGHAAVNIALEDDEKKQGPGKNIYSSLP